MHPPSHHRTLHLAITLSIALAGVAFAPGAAARCTALPADAPTGPGCAAQGLAYSSDPPMSVGRGCGFAGIHCIVVTTEAAGDPAMCLYDDDRARWVCSITFTHTATLINWFWDGSVTVQGSTGQALCDHDGLMAPTQCQLIETRRIILEDGATGPVCAHSSALAIMFDTNGNGVFAYNDGVAGCYTLGSE